MEKQEIHELTLRIGVTLRKLRKKKVGLKNLSIITGMSETQILDIELSRRNYTICNLLKYLNGISGNMIINSKIKD